MPQREQARIIWRLRGRDTEARAYLDARALGSGRIALVAEGQTRATTDPDTARRLAAALLAELTARQVTAERLGLRAELALRDFADGHLAAKTASGRYSARWLLNLASCLDRAVPFFDSVQAERATSAAERKRCRGPRNLGTIGVPDVTAFARWLAGQDNGRGGVLGAQSVRHHLSALSGLFRRAVAEGLLPVNPVAQLVDRPGVPKSRTRLLAPWETALLLESVRTLARDGRGARAPLACAFPLLAFFVYTGARENEARGTDVQDVDFGRGEILIRGTKTSGSHRYVPLHPPLRPILLEHVRTLGRLSGPLFPGARGERFGAWTKTLDAIARRAGFAPGEVRTRTFRVGYASDRLTCDGVDPGTVRHELGHASLALLDRVYAAAQRRAERMGVGGMDYTLARWAVHGELAERLEAMQAAPASEAERADVVRRFLASVAGLGIKAAAAETGVDRAAIQRLRTGAASTVKGRTLARMRDYLSRVQPEQIERRALPRVA